MFQDERFKGVDPFAGTNPTKPQAPAQPGASRFSDPFVSDPAPALEASANIDPAKAAKAQRLGKELGADPALFADDPDSVERELKSRRAAEGLKQSPKSSAWLADPSNAAVVHSPEGIEYLRGLEAQHTTLAEREQARVNAENARLGRFGFWSYAGSFSAALGQGVTGLIHLGTDLADAGLGFAGVKKETSDKILSVVMPAGMAAKQATKWLQSKQRVTPRVLIKNEATGQEEINWDAMLPTNAGGIENIMNMMAAEAAPTVVQIGLAAATGGTSAPATAVGQAGKLTKLLRVAKGIARYAKSPVSVMNAARVAQGSYENGVDHLMSQGMSEDEARQKAAPGAALAMVMSPLFGGALEAKFAEDVAKRLVRTPGMHTIGGRLLARLKAGAVGAGVEGLQESFEGIGEDLAAAISYNPDITLQQVTANIFQNFVGGVAIGGPISGVSRGTVAVNQGKAYEFVQALADSHKAVEFAKVAPEKLGDYVQKLTQGGPVENLFMGAEDWVRYFQAEGLDPKAEAEKLGITPEDFDMAVERGADLVLPTGKVAETLAATDHFQKLLPNLKPEQGGLTFGEEQRAEQARLSEEEIRKLMQTTPAHPEEAEITSRVEAQLTEAKAYNGNRTAIEETARLHARVMTVLASRAKMTPLQLYQREELNIRRSVEGLSRQQAAAVRLSPAGREAMALVRTRLEASRQGQTPTQDGPIPATDPALAAPKAPGQAQGSPEAQTPVVEAPSEQIQTPESELADRLLEAFEQAGIDPSLGTEEEAIAALENWLQEQQERRLSSEVLYQAAQRKAQAKVESDVRSEGGEVLESTTVDKLVDSSKIPTLSIQDLVGKKIFPTIADRTAAATTYTGIDSSVTNVAIPLLGGPFFPLRESNFEAGVVWANRGKGVTTQKSKKVLGGATHMLIVVGDADMHKSNTTAVTAFTQTLVAYIRDKRISKKNAAALVKLVRKSKSADPLIQQAMASFPGLESVEELESYIHGLSFGARARLADLLSEKSAQRLGAPSKARILDALREPSLAGLRWGDGSILVEIDPDSPTVNLGEGGTQPHPDFPLGIRGKVVGKLTAPINYTLLWQDWLAEKKAEGKEALRRAFELVKPVVEVTQDLVERIGEIQAGEIEGHVQAKLAAALAADDWGTSDQAVKDGGVSPQAFADAIQDSPAKAVLNEYSADEIKEWVRGGRAKLFQLGGSEIYFALKYGDPGYASDYGVETPGIGTDEVMLTSVINNEQGARGIGGPAVVLKALEQGATVLDCFAVANEKFPAGFLPELYEAFGFEKVAEVPFDPQYYSEQKLADAVKYWKESTKGWSPEAGYPPIVIMKWRGSNADRANIVQAYLRDGLAGILQGGAAGSDRLTVQELRDSLREEAGEGASDSSTARRDQGAGAASSIGRIAGKAQRVAQQIAGLSDTELANLGLTTQDREAVRRSIMGQQETSAEERERLYQSGPAPSFQARAGGANPVSVHGVHFSPAEGLTALDPSFFGKGSAGAERRRLSALEPGDPRLLRMNFYISKDGQLPPREMVVRGQNVYEAELTNLYDMAADPEGLRANAGGDANAFEQAVIDAGYDGYTSPAPGLHGSVALLGVGPVPVRSLGTATTEQTTGKAPITLDELRALRGEEEGEAGGEMRVMQGFGPADTSSAEFKAWFGDPFAGESTLVDEEGNPLPLYHGTSKAFSEFKESKTGAMGRGIYLGQRPESSEGYAPDLGGVLYKVYARGRYLDNIQWTEYVQQHGWEGAREAAIRDGWAGVKDDRFEDAVVVWDPRNIKSALSNTGAFDPGNPSILFQSAYHGSPYRFDQFSLERMLFGVGPLDHGPNGGDVLGEKKRKYDPSEAYTHDIFGAPLRRDGGGVSGAKGGDPGDPGVPGEDGAIGGDDLFRNDTPPGIYATRTEALESGLRRIGIERVTSVEDAAAALAYLGGNTVEHFDAIVVDSEGKPLAVVGAFKGDHTSTVAPLSPVLQEVSRVKGASAVWFGHNHPSGSLKFSGEDRNLWSRFENAMRGSGIEPKGLFAIGGGVQGKKGWVFLGPDGEKSGVAEPHRGPVLPIVDRAFVEHGDLGAVTSPSEAKVAAGKMGGPGVMWLGNGKVVGFTPIDKDGIATLRGSGQMNELWRGASMANARQAIILADPSIPGGVVGNLAGFLNASSLDVVDVLVRAGGPDGQGWDSWLSERRGFKGTTFFQSAYHGSPYRFDQFTLDAIGSGEGNQAYGWGLYFAGDKEVAEWYRRSLSEARIFYGQDELEFGSPEYTAASMLLQRGRSVARTREDLISYTAGLDDPGVEDSLLFLESVDPSKIRKASGDGQLYKVEIPENDQLLTQETPISEQSKQVQDALKAIVYSLSDANLEDMGLSSHAAAWREFKSMPSAGLAYTTLSSLLGGDKAVSLKLNEHGVPGMRYLDGNSRSGADGSYNYIIFDDSAVQVLETFYQNARGYLEFTPAQRGAEKRRFDMTLLKGADRSTVFHELGHFYMEVLGDLAALPDADASLKADYQTIRAWLGAEGSAPLTREQHEKFADGWLVYLLEGKAPVPDLIRPFQKFSRWLKKVGAALTGTKVDLTDEVRGVFDRLVATEEALDLAKQELGLDLFTSAEAMGMTQAEFDAYKKKLTRLVQGARDKVTRKVFDAYKEQQGEAWKQELDERADEILQELAKRPAYQATAQMLSGRLLDGTEVEVRLSKMWLTEKYGKDAVASIDPDLLATDGGVDADAAALLLGFSSGDALVKALSGLEPAGEVAYRMAEEAMRLTHGDPMSDPNAMMKASLDALTSNELSDMLAVELKALINKSEALRMGRESYVQMLAGLKAAAREHVAKQPVFKIQPFEFLRAQRKAGNEALRFAKAGNMEKAADAKKRELLNQYLYKEATEAQERAEKFRRFVKQSDKASTRLKMGKAGGDHLAQFDALRDRFGIERLPNKEVARKFTLEKWVEQQVLEGNDTAIDPALLDESKQRNYRQLTVEELDALHAALRNIKHLAYKDLYAVIEGQRIERAAMIEELAAAIRASSPQRRIPLGGSPERDTAKFKAAAALMGFDATMVKIEQLINWIDNDDVNGPAHRYIWNRIAKAQTAEYDMQIRVTKQMTTMLEAMPKEFRESWDDVIQIDGFPEPLKRSQLITMLLYMGQEERHRKLVGGLLTLGITEDAINRAVQRLNASDVKFVNDVWASFDTIWTDIAALEKRLTGVEPSRQDNKPFTLRGEDGNVIGHLTGGYFPLVADPEHTGELAKKQEGGTVQQALSSNGYARAATSTGHVKELTGKVYPLLLDFQHTMTSHLANVIKDLTHREVVLDVNRIFQNSEFQKAMREHYGPAYEAQLNPWLVNIVKDHNTGASNGLGAWNNLMTGLRGNTVAAMLGFKFGTVIIQTTDLMRLFAPGEYRLKPLQFLKAMWSFLAHPVRTANRVYELSGEMRHRAENLDRDLRARFDQLRGDESLLAQWNRAGFKALGWMDKLVSMPAWLAAYNQGVKAHGDVDRAVLEADRVVRLRLMTGNPKDIAAIQRQDGMMKLITMFMGDASANYGMLRNAGHRVSGFKGIPALTTTALMVAMSQVLGDLIKGMGPDDDDELEEWLLMKTLTAPLSTVPLVRDVASLIENYAEGRPIQNYRFTPVTQAVVKPLMAVPATVKFTNGDITWDEWGATSIESIGYAFGVAGTSQFAASAKYLRKVEEGEENPEDALDFTLGVLRGKGRKK